MMQFTASLASEQKLMLPKEMVKFAKVQIPPELFKPEWPNMRGICVTRHRDSLMTEAVHDAVLISMNGTSRTSKNSPLMRILTA